MADTPIKIRKNWGPISPITKIKASDKVYTRENKDKVRKEAIRDWYIHEAHNHD